MVIQEANLQSFYKLVYISLVNYNFIILVVRHIQSTILEYLRANISSLLEADIGDKYLCELFKKKGSKLTLVLDAFSIK